jgi:plasmid maintenance system killer protein
MPNTLVSICFKPTFLRRLHALPRALQDEAIEKIELLKHPAHHRALKVHKLHGQLAGCYSFSVNYQTRVVFEYLSKTEIVLLTIGDHDVYQ